MGSGSLAPWTELVTNLHIEAPEWQPEISKPLGLRSWEPKMAGLIECSRSFTIVRPELAFLDAGDSLDRAPLVTLGDMAALPGDAAWRVTRTRMLVSSKQSDPANSRRHQCPSHRNPNHHHASETSQRRCGDAACVTDPAPKPADFTPQPCISQGTNGSTWGEGLVWKETMALDGRAAKAWHGGKQ
jgi:hypothetical protein